MKRTVMAGILATAAATGVMAQGHILISHYLIPPYHQLVWDASVPTVGGQPVNDSNVQIQLWYGNGVTTDESALQPGEVVSINPTITYNGGGYYDQIYQVLPGWESGGTYTFQLRASGTTTHGEYFNRTLLWTEQNLIHPTSLPPEFAANITPWIGIPEPPTFALAGVGLGAAWLALLHRKSSGELESQNKRNQSAEETT